jgi:prevent-host-death family protein
MIRIGESDFLRAFDAMSEMAQKDPVTITKQGRDRLVVMSAEEYSRLRRGEGQPRGAASPAGRSEPDAAGASHAAH